MEFFSCFGDGSDGIFLGFESPQVYPLVVRADVGLVMPARTFVNAFGIGGGGDPTAGVPTVLCLRGNPQIGHSVIPRASVLVV